MLLLSRCQSTLLSTERRWERDVKANFSWFNIFLRYQRIISKWRSKRQWKWALSRKIAYWKIFNVASHSYTYHYYYICTYIHSIPTPSTTTVTRNVFGNSRNTYSDFQLLSFCLFNACLNGIHWMTRRFHFKLTLWHTFTESFGTSLCQSFVPKKVTVTRINTINNNYLLNSQSNPRPGVTWAGLQRTFHWRL